MRNTFIFSIVLLLFIFSCNKDDNKDSAIDDPEVLSNSDNESLENAPEANSFDFSTVILPNEITIDEYMKEIDSLFYNEWNKSTNSDPYENLGPQDAKNLLIARITMVALNLTNRSKYQIPDEGAEKPAQNGLAYSWGSKDFKIRQSPPGFGTVCMEKIYGLDCSGFVSQLFKNAGVSLIGGPADSQRKASILQKAINSSIPALKKVKVEELGKIPTSKFVTGDVVYWMNDKNIATHIGIVLKDINGSLAVFQSNGVPGINSADCLKNRSTSRGPRRLQLSDTYWFGSSKSYGITRINMDISGKWNLFLKCKDETYDAITFSLDFPTTNSNTFNISGTGIDYDDKSFTCTGSLTYDNASNILSGTLFILKPSSPEFYRYDSFSVKLNRDETGYFDLVLGNSNNAGCDLQGRLKNNE